MVELELESKFARPNSEFEFELDEVWASRREFMFESEFSSWSSSNFEFIELTETDSKPESFRANDMLLLM